MVTSILFEMVVILALIMANGWLARSEMSVVSAKRVRLERMARDGDVGARRTLRLLDQPGDFLAFVQIGITLIGVLAGAFGGATISTELRDAIEHAHPSLSLYAEGIAFGLVVVGITFVSLILGELVPKRMALAAPERFASDSAGILLFLAPLARPVVRVLSTVTDGVLKATGYSKPTEQAVTEDEVEILVDQGEQTGVFGTTESSIIRRAMRLGDLRVSHLMTPRTRVQTLDPDAGPVENLRRVASSNYSYYPLIRGDWAEIVGVVSGKLLLRRFIAGDAPDPSLAVLTPLFFPETTPADQAMEKFRESGVHVAMVIDEHGGVAGMVTLADTVEALVGGFSALGADAGIVTREDGSLLVDGLVTMPELARHLGVSPEAIESPDFETLGGLVMDLLGEVPSEGNVVRYRGFRFEVVDMDGHRVDKVLVSRPIHGDASRGSPRRPSGPL